VVRRKTAQLLCARVKLFQLRDREINFVRQRFRFLAARSDVNQSQDYRSTVDVVSRRARNSPARIVKQLRVELGRFVQIIDLQDYSKKIRGTDDVSFRR